MRRLTLSLIVTLAIATTAAAQKSEKTVVNDPAAKQMLLGVHRLSLQWISWDYFGKVTVTERNGTLFIKGEQRGRGNADFVTLDGRVARLDAKEFTFVGDI